jgi:glycosyltransferase involved in cell wall biosynthesis
MTRHLLHVFPTFAPGGVQIRISTLINHFGAKYRHTILSLDGQSGCAERLDPELGVKVQPWRDDGSILTRLFAHRRALADLAPDLLLTYNWGAVEWALANTLFKRCRHIHLESGFGPDEADGQIPRRVRFRRIALRGAQRLIVPSQTLVRIASDIWKIPAEKLLYIPNGVDCEKFAAAPDPSAAPGFQAAPGEVVIGALAPLRPEKNLGRLIRAAASLAPRYGLRLLIAGDGSERGALETCAKEQGIADRTFFAGHVAAPEKVLGLMDVLAITSDTEQMPNSEIQAMAAGLPVVGMDVGDVKAVLPAESQALIAPKNDGEAFRANLERLLADDDWRRAMGRANQAHVRRTYDLQRMFDAYEAVFDA